MLPSHYWQDLTWKEFANLPNSTVAVLPVGSIEQHGPHLPVSVDSAINTEILSAALRIIPDSICVLALPLQSIGLSVEHTDFPGTITASAETLLSLWTEIGHSVVRAGIRKIVVFNSHGGQSQLTEILCRRLRIEAGMFAISCNWTTLSPPEGLPDPHGIHGGRVETAMMMAIQPTQVDMTLAEDFRSAWARLADSFSALRDGRGIGLGWKAQDLHVTGAIGNAMLANADDGRRVIDSAAVKLAELLIEVERFDHVAWLNSVPVAR